MFWALFASDVKILTTIFSLFVVLGHFFNFHLSEILFRRFEDCVVLLGTSLTEKLKTVSRFDLLARAKLNKVHRSDNHEHFNPGLFDTVHFCTIPTAQTCFFFSLQIIVRYILDGDVYHDLELVC